MDEKKIKQLAKAAQKIKMSGAEKTRIRAFIIERMKDMPVRDGDTVRLQGYKRSFNPLITNILTSLRYMAIVLIIALLVGGGVSAASQNALPGDALYGVKVGFTEEVRAAFAFSEEAKARFEAQRAERRLQEAEKLAAQGRLDAAAHATAQGNFEAHADRAKERIARLEAEGNLDAAASISSNFETTLRTHEAILIRLSQEKPGSREELIDLGATVRSRAESAAQIRVDVEAQVSAGAQADVEAAAQGALRATRNKIAEVRKFIERKKAALSAEATVNAEARLSVAEETVMQGETKLNAQLYGEAFVLFQQAHRIAQEAQVMAEAQTNLDVEINIDAGINIRNSEGRPPTSENTGAHVESRTTIDGGNESVESEGNVKVEIGL